MANVSRVNGLRPVKHLNGSPYNGQANWYFIPSTDSTAVFLGDPVKLAGSASADGYPTVAQAAASNVALGVVVGFKPDPTNLNVPIYRAASTNRYVLVADAPDIVYEVQSNGTTVAADVGLNANITVGAGSTTTGASGVQLDDASKATTATLPLKIIGFVDRIDNDITSANAKVLVTINNHQYTSGTGTVGT